MPEGRFDPSWPVRGMGQGQMSRHAAGCACGLSGAFHPGSGFVPTWAAPEGQPRLARASDCPISPLLPCCGARQGPPCARPAPLRASPPTRIPAAAFQRSFAGPLRKLPDRRCRKVSGVFFIATARRRDGALAVPYGTNAAGRAGRLRPVRTMCGRSTSKLPKRCRALVRRRSTPVGLRSSWAGYS